MCRIQAPHRSRKVGKQNPEYVADTFKSCIPLCRCSVCMHVRSIAKTIVVRTARLIAHRIHARVRNAHRGSQLKVHRLELSSQHRPSQSGSSRSPCSSHPCHCSRSDPPSMSTGQGRCTCTHYRGTCVHLHGKAGSVFHACLLSTCEARSRAAPQHG
jgi:hypothetical protein